MNRVIVITGANNGIGLAMTRSLLEVGDCVAVLDLETNNLDQTHPNLLPFRCDVTQPQQIQASIDDVVSKWGRVDVLINNACLALFIPFEQSSVDDIRREFEVNYFGYLNMIRAVIPVMKNKDMALSTTSVPVLALREYRT